MPYKIIEATISNIEEKDTNTDGRDIVSTEVKDASTEGRTIVSTEAKNVNTEGRGIVSTEAKDTNTDATNKDRNELLSELPAELRAKVLALRERESDVEKIGKLIKET